MSDHARQIPEGWVWVSIRDITHKVSNVKPESTPNQLFGYVDISAIDNVTHTIVEHKSFIGKDAPSRARRPISTDDVLFSNVRTYLRNIALVPETLDAYLASTGFTVLRSNGSVVPTLLFRYVMSDEFIETVTPQQTGTHYPATSDRVVMEQPFPLPPLAEQERIVAVIENLLERVKIVKKRLDNAAETMKRFRKSVLNAACTGKLTEDWREQNRNEESADILLSNIKVERDKKIKKKGKGVISDFVPNGCNGWINVKGGQLFSWSSGKFLPKKKQDGGEYPVYGGNGITGWHSEYLVSNPTLVIGRVGAHCGNVHVATGMSWVTDNAIYATYVPEGIELKYMYFVFKTSDLNANAGGSGQPFVNQEHLNDLELPLPPSTEQTEIVCRVEKLLEFADKIEKRISGARGRIDKLTQSILAKAFRGELVPTEVELARIEGREYETAEQLLIKIKKEKDKTKVRKKKVEKKLGAIIVQPVSVHGEINVELKAKPLLETISARGEISPEDLLISSKYSVDTIEDFYEELAQLEKQGKIEDYRPNNRLSILRLKKTKEK